MLPLVCQILAVADGELTETQRSSILPQFHNVENSTYSRLATATLNIVTGRVSRTYARIAIYWSSHVQIGTSMNSVLLLDNVQPHDTID